MRTAACSAAGTTSACRVATRRCTARRRRSSRRPPEELSQDHHGHDAVAVLVLLGARAAVRHRAGCRRRHGELLWRPGLAGRERHRGDDSQRSRVSSRSWAISSRPTPSSGMRTSARSKPSEINYFRAFTSGRKMSSTISRIVSRRDGLEGHQRFVANEVEGQGDDSRCQRRIADFASLPRATQEVFHRQRSVADEFFAKGRGRRSRLLKESRELNADHGSHGHAGFVCPGEVGDDVSAQGAGIGKRQRFAVERVLHGGDGQHVTAGPATIDDRLARGRAFRNRVDRERAVAAGD